jgi:hypothetical protein
MNARPQFYLIIVFFIFFCLQTFFMSLYHLSDLSSVRHPKLDNRHTENSDPGENGRASRAHDTSMGDAAIAESIRLLTVALLKSHASQKFDRRQSLNFAALRLRAP